MDQSWRPTVLQLFFSLNDASYDRNRQIVSKNVFFLNYKINIFLIPYNITLNPKILDLIFEWSTALFAMHVCWEKSSLNSLTKISIILQFNGSIATIGLHEKSNNLSIS